MEVYAQIQQERAARQERRAKRLEREARAERVVGLITSAIGLAIGMAGFYAWLFAIALFS